MKLLSVVGARPNFMKIAPVARVLARYPEQFDHVLVHTGQHYDANMSQVFFDELDLPRPAINLEVGSGSHAQQTAQIMQRFEPIVLQHRPDWILVPGDVNSTVACSLVAAKLGVKIAHVEAGLRSFDRAMPEEINRVVTDHLSDVLFTSEPSGAVNLAREGIDPARIHFVGNTMIDTLVHLLPKAASRWETLQRQHQIDRYVLVTLHRPANVDDDARLRALMALLQRLAATIQVVFPVHPRTRARLNQVGSDRAAHPAPLLLEPLSYLDFTALESHAALVLTDSGGVQEETTWLGVPCVTVRANTERPVTVDEGTNVLFSGAIDALEPVIHAQLAHPRGEHRVPAYWDGRAAERIVAVLQQLAHAGR